jgi:hypothetical protein
MTTSMKPSARCLSYSDLSREDLRKTFCLFLTKSEIIRIELAAGLNQFGNLQKDFKISVISDKVQSE